MCGLGFGVSGFGVSDLSFKAFSTALQSVTAWLARALPISAGIDVIGQLSGDCGWHTHMQTVSANRKGRKPECSCSQSSHLVSAFVAPGVHPAAPVPRGRLLAEGMLQGSWNNAWKFEEAVMSQVAVYGAGLTLESASDARCRRAHSVLRARATDVGARLSCLLGGYQHQNTGEREGCMLTVSIVWLLENI